MNNRKVIVFKVNGEVVAEERKDLTIDEVETMRWIVAEEIGVPIFDVEVEVKEVSIELSEDIDVGSEGLYSWKSIYFKPIQGLKCTLEEGSDEYLDALNSGTLEEYLIFFE